MVHLQITLKIAEANRATAARIYRDYKRPFLDTIAGATSKDLLIREEDVQVLHGFDSIKNAKGYLTSELFANDVVGELKPLLDAEHCGTACACWNDNGGRMDVPAWQLDEASRRGLAGNCRRRFGCLCVSQTGHLTNVDFKT